VTPSVLTAAVCCEYGVRPSVQEAPVFSSLSLNTRRSKYLFAVLLLLAMPSAFAQVVKRGDSELDRLQMTKRELRVTKILVDAEKQRLFNRKAIKRFREAYPGKWRFLIDRRTGHVNLIEGGAIPFIPGHANRLADNAACRTASCTSPEKVVAAAREFLARNRDALQVDPEQLQLDPGAVTAMGDSIYLVRFQWKVGGVPVEGGSVFFSINNGNLVQIGTQNIAAIKLDPKPAISVERAWDVVRRYIGGAGDRQRDVVVNPGTLSILPVTSKSLDPDNRNVPFGEGIDYVLVYRLAFKRPGVLGTWEGVVNAHTGELLQFRDQNVYGHVQGGVYKTDVPAVEVSVPFPKADYGAGVYADQSGDFPGIVGTSTMTGLNVGGVGNAGGVIISDTCGLISLGSSGAGVIDFGSSAGTDCTTPGFGDAGNTHASRTQYWNVTQIKMKAITYLPTNGWLQGPVTDYVNLNDVCNAYWDGALNFFKTGTLPANSFWPWDQTCGNTGELPGISLHEWGHGMDQNDGSPGPWLDNRPIETRADWSAILQTHQSCLGGGFSTNRVPAQPFGQNCVGYGNPCSACTGIRDVDFALHATATAWTPQNHGTVWGGAICSASFYTGPCNWEDHCESGVASQALWDFVNRDLVASATGLDIDTAWQLSDRLFYTGMPMSTDMYSCTTGGSTVSDGCAAGTLYSVMRTIDDDGDGLANGTPHAAAIFAALDRHGIACGAAGDATNQNFSSCPALTTPVLTATATSGQVDLSWTTGGASATRYFVFRNETSCGSGYTLITTVPASTLAYTDTTVVHGLTYYYRIQAATAFDSCVSAMSNCATQVAALPPDRDFYVRDWTDNAGSHDLGEEPSTHFMTNWAYSSDVWNRPNNTPGAINAFDWYPTDNLYAGAAFGDNVGFTRISRNTSGSAETVMAEILISPLGVGSNFSTVASTMVPFAAGDTAVVQGAAYNQPAVASTHACIAVQISTTSPPADPFQSPNLNGHSPGDPDGQSLILADNNKAQRNLGVSHNVPHLAGLHYALIHNPGLATRDMVLRFDAPDVENLRGAQVQVVGGKTVDFRPGGTVVFEAMVPGENRWVALRAAPDKEVSVHFYDMAGDRTLNAFTLLLQPIPLADSIRDNLRNDVQVFNRLAAAFTVKGAAEEARAATKLLDQKEIKIPQYLAFLNRQSKLRYEVLASLIRQRGGRDEFGVIESTKALDDAARRKAGACGLISWLVVWTKTRGTFRGLQILSSGEQAASEHGMLLNRLDAYATMLQKSDGDAADVLQMVRWQERLYRTNPRLARIACAPQVVAASQEFLSRWEARKPMSYSELLRALASCYRATADALGNDAVKNAAASLASATGSDAAQEKLHRNFLTALDRAVGSAPK